MRKIELHHPSGIDDVRWVAECDACGAQQEVAHARSARCWEQAHRRFGCARRLVQDESGRGWRPSRWNPDAAAGRGRAQRR